jgi:hypothetical protein
VSLRDIPGELKETDSADVRRDVLAVIPWLLLPYDSVTHLLGLSAGATSETLPATALLAIPYLLARGRVLRICPDSRSVLKLLIKCVAVTLIVTAVNFAGEQSGGFRADFPSLRVITAARQGTSMAFGVASFLMFQDALLRLRVKVCMTWIVIGMIPEFVIVGAQVAHHAYRVNGFSPEPADLGDLLVFGFLPACVVAGMEMRGKLLGMVAGVGTLLRAFSGTALMEGFFVTGALFWMKRQYVLGAILVGIFSVSVYVVFRLFPANYVVSLVSFIIANYKTSGHLASGSLVDRLYGLLGPILLMRTPHAWLGFGFGGDSVYFYHLFPADISRIIRSTKLGFLSISSLQGKMLLYGGIVGYGYYIAAWRKAWSCGDGSLLSRIMLLGAFATSLFSLGPFFIPYVWLWLAVASTWQMQGLTFRRAG